MVYRASKDTLTVLKVKKSKTIFERMWKNTSKNILILLNYKNIYLYLSNDALFYCGIKIYLENCFTCGENFFFLEENIQ